LELRVGGAVGKLIGLAALIDEHDEAIEFDLLRLGYRLRWLDSPTQDFTWRDLWVLVRNLGPDSATHVAVNGREESEWTLANHLLAMIAENTSLAIWMKTTDAQKKPPRNRPKPIFRPGVEDDSKQKIGKDTLPAADMISWLGPGYAALAA
jgi:hypothetical protein